MGIPQIRPYPMPSRLPPRVAAWTPRPDRAALLIHDMQRYFIDAFPAGRPPVTDLLANTQRLRDAATRVAPVFYTAQPNGSSRGLLRDFWGPGMGAGGREIVAPLAPRAGDVVLAKHRYSAFHGSDLADRLAAAGRDQLIVCGVYAHIGCLMTAIDAFSRDIEVFLVADAVADFSAREHRMALQYAAGRCAVTLTTRRLLRYLGR